jgi:Protein of unknown function (DUF3489)
MCPPRGVVDHNMQMETKYLHLRDSVEFGTRFGDWQVCWIGGWARFRLYFLVMLVKIPLPSFSQGCDEATPIGARILVTDRTIDLAFGAERVMNGVAMNTFTIDANNNITAFASLDQARAAKIQTAEYFGSSQELAKLVQSWPRTRPVEIWNSFAGVAPFTALKPLKKFTDRNVAVTRIWEAIQVLLANVGKQATHVAPAKGKRNKDAPKSKRRPTAPAAAKDPVNVAREGSKKSEVIDLMRRPQGATLAEIMDLTGWQSHTVRGFVSGTLIKKLSLNVESFRSKEKERSRPHPRGTHRHSCLRGTPRHYTSQIRSQLIQSDSGTKSPFTTLGAILDFGRASPNSVAFCGKPRHHYIDGRSFGQSLLHKERRGCNRARHY